MRSSRIAEVILPRLSDEKSAGEKFSSYPTADRSRKHSRWQTAWWIECSAKKFSILPSRRAASVSIAALNLRHQYKVAVSWRRRRKTKAEPCARSQDLFATVASHQSMLRPYLRCRPCTFDFDASCHVDLAKYGCNLRKVDVIHIGALYRDEGQWASGWPHASPNQTVRKVQVSWYHVLFSILCHCVCICSLLNLVH